MTDMVDKPRFFAANKRLPRAGDCLTVMLKEHPFPKQMVVTTVISLDPLMVAGMDRDNQPWGFQASMDARIIHSEYRLRANDHIQFQNEIWKVLNVKNIGTQWLPLYDVQVNKLLPNGCLDIETKRFHLPIGTDKWFPVEIETSFPAEVFE